MGDTLNTMTAGIASGGVGAVPSLFDSGGGKPTAQAPYAPAYQQNSGDNIFQAYGKYLPSSFNSSQPVNDPSSILNAYMKNLPVFQQAANNTKDVSTKIPDLAADPRTGSWRYRGFLSGHDT